MPRKPGIGPAILRIEGLSTGKDPLAVDEFDGTPLEQPYAKPPRIDNAQAARDAMNRAKREAKRELLQSVGILPKPPEPPKLQSNQAIISDDTGPKLILSWPKGKKRLRRL
jgi:hypothetical protein